MEEKGCDDEEMNISVYDQLVFVDYISGSVAII